MICAVNCTFTERRYIELAARRFDSGFGALPNAFASLKLSSRMHKHAISQFVQRPLDA